ncbi:MAG: VOC family protein [Caulobacteraceae bacterium]
MRLRQVALMARSIAPVAEALDAVFGLEVAYRDPAVGVFGLANVVMPVGGEFLEVLEPLRADASGARYLARRGGDAGYMIILQDEDALAHRARLEAAGVRAIAKGDGAGYRYTHFHPADCAGVLLSIDSVAGDGGWRAAMSDWPPAGPDWRAHPSGASRGIFAVTVQARDPEAAAARWSSLLDRPARGDVVTLERGEIRFVPPVDADGTGVVGLDIVVADPREIIARAERFGVPALDGTVTIGGVAIRPISPLPTGEAGARARLGVGR